MQVPAPKRARIKSDRCLPKLRRLGAGAEALATCCVQHLQRAIRSFQVLSCWEAFRSEMFVCVLSIIVLMNVYVNVCC